MVDPHPTSPGVLTPLVVLAGPTASGKTALALRLAQALSGEIVSCDSVAVYRGMDIGSAKPTPEERAQVPHHLLDVFSPDQPCTAGDYSRLARRALAGIAARHCLPIVTGGTGLYLRALLDGLSPAPTRDDALRTRLRHLSDTRGLSYLHRILTRLDPAAARAIHPNDTPKLIRALEATLAASQPLTEQWRKGRDPLTGFRILRLGLNPPRAELYARIDARAAAMFARGLLEETAQLLSTYGAVPKSQGYAQATAFLQGKITREEAVKSAQQGHRNYAKRQLTWFRREPRIDWLAGFGDNESTYQEAHRRVAFHLKITSHLT